METIGGPLVKANQAGTAKIKMQKKTCIEMERQIDVGLTFDNMVTSIVHGDMRRDETNYLALDFGGYVGSNDTASKV